jgi:hypothetical protein
MSTTAGSSSHSTSTSAAASSPWLRDSATTTATASPWQHARSMAIACCGGDLMPFRCPRTATQGVQYSATARPSNTAITPGALSALAKSSLRMRACACGLRTNTACARRGKRKSSTKAPRPCSRRWALGRGTLWPM